MRMKPTFNFMNVQNEIGLINDKLDLTTGGGEFKKTAIVSCIKCTVSEWKHY